MDIMTQVGIVLLIVLLIVALLIWGIVSMFKSRSREKKKWDDTIAQKGAIVGAKLPLFSGLPLAENTACQIFANENHLIIEAQNQVFQIETSKIIAAQAKTDVDIQKEVTSSGGKAIAGALLFGPVGAIIGARPKTKKYTVVTTYLIINYYNQSGNTDVLAFVGADAKLLTVLNEQLQRTRSGTVTNL